MTFAYGCHVNDTDQTGFGEAIELARLSDVVIFIGGINESIEHEGSDRTTIDLPPIQLALIEQLEKVSRSPIHVVIMSGSSLDLTYIRDSNLCSSLTWMGYAGQQGGLALANVMFGQYNPGGRLPITFYPSSYVDAVSMFDMQMRPSSTNPGRTYKFYTGEAVFQFGDGLSYTTFNYSWFNDSINSIVSIQSLTNDQSNQSKILFQSYRINVTNIGDVAGNDAVLGYVKPPQKSFNDPSPPIQKLFGFERVYLNVGETTEVYFPLNIQSLLTVGLDGTKWIEPGLYRILIGDKHIHSIYLQGNPTRFS